MVSPIWWYSLPAMLKGYIDRVFSQGFAYEYAQTGPRGLLSGKRAVIITTSGADENVANQTGMMNSINTSIVNGIFSFCGFAEARHKNCYAVPMVSDEDRKRMLEEVREFIKNI